MNFKVLRKILVCAALVLGATAFAETTVQVSRPAEHLIKFEICDDDGDCRPVVGETGVYRLADVQALAARQIPLSSDAVLRRSSWIGAVLIGFGTYTSGIAATMIPITAARGLSMIPLLPLPVLGISFVIVGGAHLTHARRAAQSRIAQLPEMRQSGRLGAMLGPELPPTLPMSELTENLALDLSPLRSLTSCELELETAV